ncbi:MAG: carbamoyl phosphate synthase small subunit, partial [Halieaceae bacterium]
MSDSAVLVLEDGATFRGRSIGAPGSTVGEVVFNTAMTGYQEILTDPSYCRQIVTLTYPHIGNTGVNADDEESLGIQAAGLIIRDLPLIASSFRSERSLSDYLSDENIVAIADIDTRRLTRLLRDKGAQNGCIMAGATLDEAEALAQARGFGGLKGLDLAKVVTTSTPYEWDQGSWQLGAPTDDPAQRPASRFHVVALDFGVKRNILRILVDLGCRVTVVPAQTSFEEVLTHNPDGMFLSNGPGDPEPCEYAI